MTTVCRVCGNEGDFYFRKNWWQEKQCKDCRRTSIKRTKEIRMGAQMTKKEQALRGQTAMARKVFNCVPIQQKWGVSEIISEIKRRGIGTSKSQLEGCLWSLRESGLVTETTGLWQQIADKPVVKEETIEEKQQTAGVVMTVEEKGKRNPMDILAEIGEMAKNLATAIDDAALEIAQHMQDASADSAKLKQLQNILQGL